MVWPLVVPACCTDGHILHSIQAPHIGLDGLTNMRVHIWFCLGGMALEEDGEEGEYD